MNGNGRKPTPRTVLTGLDVEAGKYFIASIKLKVEPEEVKQRKAFEELMPEIYDLRNSGYSWDQITAFLNQIGFTLQPNTVRTYYSGTLGGRRDVCEKRMKEQRLLMLRLKQEVQKPTADAELMMEIQVKNEKAIALSQEMLEKVTPVQ